MTRSLRREQSNHDSLRSMSWHSRCSYSWQACWYVHRLFGNCTLYSFMLRHEAAMLFFSFCLFFLLSMTRWAEAAEYQEKLSLKPLPNSALLAAFNFRSNTSLSAFDDQNFRFFPRSLGQILQHAHTKELHLRFSLGRWDAQTWGARPRGGRREGGTGVELWAWIEADTDQEYVSSYRA